MEILDVLGRNPDLEKYVAERPQIQEGIRNVNVENYVMPIQARQLLDKYQLLASGSEAMVFVNEEEAVVVRLEYSNSPVENFLREYITERSKRVDEEEKKVYEAALRRLRRTETAYEGGARELLERIAAHNNQFVKDPSTTIPINRVFAVNGEPFALWMKFLDGRSANSGELTPKEQQLLMELTGTDDPTNFMVDIKNSAIPRQFIDVKRSSV